MTADERIEALLKRAGCPMMVVHTTEPTKVSLPVDELVDTIDRLEAALENALNERDALMEDLRLTVVTSDEGCTICKHIDMPLSTDPCGSCTHGEYAHWEWRGVPDKED